MNKIEWEEFINSLQNKETDLSLSKEDIILQLSNLVEKTVLDYAKKATGKIGVLFSGGVDSTLICYILQKNNIPFIAATVGFQDLKNPQIIIDSETEEHNLEKGFLRCQKFYGRAWGVKKLKMPRSIFRHNDDQKFPDDVLEARVIAKEHGFSHVEKIYTFDEISELFLETIKILKSDLTNAVNVGVGSVEVAGVKLLKETDSNITHIFGGLGSEEIYAGYKRHADSSDKHLECWNGLRNMFERDLLRDFAIEKALGVSFLVPFLDKNMITFSMGIPIDLKINTTSSKIILREAALKLGLAKNYAFRPKKAAQYGSRTDKAIAKLARKSGFSLKKEYLAFLVKQLEE